MLIRTCANFSVVCCWNWNGTTSVLAPRSRLHSGRKKKGQDYTAPKAPVLLPGG